MGRADHLREVDNDWVTVFAADEDVEFIEVSVDEACARKPDNEVHKLRVEFPRRRDVRNLPTVLQGIVRRGRTAG